MVRRMRPEAPGRSRAMPRSGGRAQSHKAARAAETEATSAARRGVNHTDRFRALSYRLFPRCMMCTRAMRINEHFHLCWDPSDPHGWVAYCGECLDRAAIEMVVDGKRKRPNPQLNPSKNDLKAERSTSQA